MSTGFPPITVRSEKHHKLTVQLAYAAAAIILFSILLFSAACTSLQPTQSSSSTPPPTPIALTASLPSATVGTAYSGRVAASGGVPPYQYTSGGSLPPGVTLDAHSGAVAGTPTTAGSFSFAVEATDSAQSHSSAQLSLAVARSGNSIKVSVSPASVSVASGATQLFSATVTNSSNSAVTWSATQGKISSSGSYSAPTVTANSTVTVTATSVADSAVTASASVTITPVVTGNPLSITTKGVPTTLAGSSYATSLNATGGKSPYQWGLVSGPLPTGIALNPTGVLSGTTNETGQFSFNVRVSDSSSPALTAQASFTLEVNPANHVQINALFPPMGPGNSMWSGFNTYVLTSPYLDGVNPGLDWAAIETSQGVYDFSKFDASLQAFYDAGKKVNLIIRPVSNGGTNTATPAYVFTSQWAASLGAAPLDVVTCKGYPGNGQANSGFPVVYETPFKAAYKKFVAAVLAHYANNSHIGYVRVGLAVGGEAFPWCSTVLPGFSQNTWLGYVDEMDAYEKSLNPTMQLMAALNQVYSHGVWDQSYPTAEATSAVANGQGIGSQGWQESDITNYSAGLPCTSNWCALFDQYTGQVPLELQQAGQSVANGGTTTGSMANIIPFAVARHVTIFEIYVQDLLTAFDPNWPSYSTYGPAYRQAMVTAHGPR